MAQKKIADDQKQLAVENASKADENARKAELRLAEGLISQADALSLAGRFDESHSLYAEAYDNFADLKAPLVVAEVGLWNSYRQKAFPLLSFTGVSVPVRCVAIAADGRTALSGADKTLKLWDVATGTELRTFTGHTDFVWSVAICPGRSIRAFGESRRDAAALGPCDGKGVADDSWPQRRCDQRCHRARMAELRSRRVSTKR